MSRRIFSPFSLPFVLALAACGGGATPMPTPQTPTGPPPTVTASNAIITPNGTATEPELARVGSEALLRQQWKEAADAYALLVKAITDGPNAPTYLFNLALAYEGLEERDKARDTYRDLARRFPASANARTALVRAATLNAYLEDWKALGEVADAMLARSDIDDVDRMMAFGARGLSKVEQGDARGARKDILDGLDIADRTHYASPDVLPIAVAQLRFAFGEVKRMASEQIKFEGVAVSDFLAAIEARCAGLLEAQDEYAEAVHASDPHWAAMAGYRVGEMYRNLHADLTAIKPPPEVKTERLRQVFYAFMHIRYRVLLEKGMKQLDDTIKLGKRINDTSSWIKRAEAAKKEMELAIQEEKAQIAQFPFTEDEVRKSLKDLADKVAKQQAKPPKK
jgi:tetratricopeptide (TPR) repeat protein